MFCACANAPARAVQSRISSRGRNLRFNEMSPDPASAWTAEALRTIANIRGTASSEPTSPRPAVPTGWNQTRGGLLRLGAEVAEFHWETPRGKLQVHRHGASRADSSPHCRRYYVSGKRAGLRWSAGFVELGFPEPVAPPQHDAIRAVVAAFADRLLYANDQIIAQHCVRAVTEAERLVGYRAGAAIGRAVTRACLAMRGHHAAYISLDARNACLEYYQRSAWRPTSTAHFTTDKVITDLTERCAQDLARQQLAFTDPTGEVAALLRSGGLAEPKPGRYAIQPMYIGEVVVGAMVVAVAEQTPGSPAVQGPALQAMADLLSRHAGRIHERRFHRVIVDPVFGERNVKVQDDLVFVLMPFTEDWSERIWSRVLRPTIETLGLRAQRADDLFGHDVMEDIWGGILSARVVVADITARNANVFYELGIAHTLGKDVVLLTQDTADIPFDLNRFRHVIYADNLDGYDVLKGGLRGTISHLLREPATAVDS